MKQANRVDCFACGKKKLSKDEVGLNKKLNGRKVKQFYCLECFAVYLDVSTVELLARIEDFKEQGCSLF